MLLASFATPGRSPGRLAIAARAFATLLLVRLLLLDVQSTPTVLYHDSTRDPKRLSKQNQPNTGGGITGRAGATHSETAPSVQSEPANVLLG